MYVSGRKAEKKATCILCIVCLRASLLVFGAWGGEGRSRGGGGDDERKLLSLLFCHFDYSSPPLD